LVVLGSGWWADLLKYRGTSAQFKKKKCYLICQNYSIVLVLIVVSLVQTGLLAVIPYKIVLVVGRFI
jgi:hypothetical protein